MARALTRREIRGHVKHKIERAIEALEPLDDEEKALAVRLSGRTSAPAKKVKRKYTKRKALGEVPQLVGQLSSVPEPVEPKAAPKAKAPAKKGGLAALKRKTKGE